MRHKILLGVPSSGTISEASAEASWLCSLHHDVDRVPSCMSAPNFNNVWCAALNGRGKYTHFAMMHTDIAVKEEEPGKRWLDLLVEEMEATQADFVSCPVAIKDHHGLTSSGIGDPYNRWNPYRRFTLRELATLPQRFDARDAGYGDKFLLHNHALCLWDMRRPFWYYPDDNGSCRAVFNFSEDIRLVDGKWVRYQESEDWAFSRALWQLGARTYITQRITVLHQGGMTFPNKGDYGWEHDEATKANWQHDGSVLNGKEAA